MDITRMHIVSLLLFSIVIPKISSIEATARQITSSNGMCEGDWSYSYGSCYSPIQTWSRNGTAMQQHCKDMDSNMIVLNTRDEIVAAIENGIFNDDDGVCQGQISNDNGATWTNLDGSSEETYIETLPISDFSGGNIARVCCVVFLEADAGPCYGYSAAQAHQFYCEKPGPYVNFGPCDVKIHQKLRMGATRKISFKHMKPYKCYIELWRSIFRPAQIKIYGYNFPSTSSTCSQGFFVQNTGEEVLAYLLKNKLTCGNNGGPNGPLIRKRSGRGGKIRLYIVMNGDGRRVWLRAKGRRFRY